MQYYTRQQLVGSGKYSQRVRIGNWNEDLTLQEVKLREYIAAKEAGALSMDKHAVRLRTALAEVELKTVKEDEYVHLGDVLQLSSKETSAVLAGDLGEKDPRDSDSHAVTYSLISDPCARNTFVLEKYVPKEGLHNTTFFRDFNGETLCYGQTVMIRINPKSQELPGTLQEPLYLTSSMVDMQHFSKITKNQEVRLTPNTSYLTAWKVLPVKTAHRDIAEGEPVLAGAPVVLKHCATNNDLACLGVVQMNDFGNEFEACCSTVATVGKRWSLQKDLLGTYDSQFDAEGGSPNTFVFITGNLK